MNSRYRHTNLLHIILPLNNLLRKSLLFFQIKLSISRINSFGCLRCDPLRNLHSGLLALAEEHRAIVATVEYCK